MGNKDRTKKQRERIGRRNRVGEKRLVRQMNTETEKRGKKAVRRTHTNRT